MIILLLLFCLSRCSPLDPHVVDCLHILNMFVVLTTDKPQLFTVIFYFIIYSTNSTGKRWVFVIYQHKVKCNLLIIILLNAIVTCERAVSTIWSHYDFVYVIDINTHVLSFFNYYIVVPFAQFWTTSRFKKLVGFWCIWHSVVICQVKT